MSKSSKTNTTQNTATNLTQTPTNPDWVTSGVQGLGTTLTNLGNADPSSFVAGADPLQTTAAAGAAGLTTPAAFATGASDLSSVGPNAVGPNSLLPNLQSYMNPYTDDVVNTSLADYDKNAGYTRAQNQLSLANDDTFGGSGGAIQTAISNDNIDRGRASLDAGLRDQAFTAGAGLANDDANRAQAGQQESAADTLAAGQGLTANAAGQNVAENTNIDTQSSIGQILQALAQAHASAPLATAGALDSMWAGLPTGLFHGTTANGTSNSTGTSSTTTTDPMGSLGSLISAGGSLASGLGAMGLAFSDERLKRDVVKIGERDGLGVYLYRYLWSPVLHAGLIAQEVLKAKPWAVVTHPSGYLMVDYGKL